MARITSMALGTLSRQAHFEGPAELLGERLRGIYKFLAEHGDVLFPDGYFADLYTKSQLGQPTVPARVVATAMLLQSHEGLSDREATDRLGRDLAWQAAAGVHTGYEAFHPTLLVGMRNRLRSSARPKRLFEDTKKAAKQAGVMKDRARVVDSTPVYDAVATEDTVTQLRSAVRKLLRLLEGTVLEKKLRSALARDDDYRSPGKPPCDWDDPAARDALVDALVKDAKAALAALAGEQLDSAVIEAVELLALVAGQDVEQKQDGTFAIAKKVAKDRTISTVDPEARHGHKSRDRHFDGYKAHVSIDPDSELVDEVSVTAGNVADRAPLDELLSPVAELAEKPAIFGDSAYADGETLERLEGQGFEVMAKVPPAVNKDGLFTKDDFTIDPNAGTVACPAGQTATVRFFSDGSGIAGFGKACATCPLAGRCTTNSSGRTVTLHRHERLLQDHKAVQATPKWQEAYKATRPKVERKIGHIVRKAWGGRKARARGVARVTTDVVARAAAVNLARLHVLGIRWDGAAWAAGP
jgi:Transposase DDE domain/Transposase domain (DUF772)